MWYKDANPTFEWVIPSGADAVQTSIDNNTSGVPHITYSPAISEKTVKGIKDGVWYFIRARKGGVWGPISTYIVRVDSTAPQQKNVEFSYDESTHALNITADIQDITSGIDNYKIFINDVLVKTVPAKEFVDGKYSLSFNSAGHNEVRLVAIDQAGNSVESSGTFFVTSVPVPDSKPVVSTAPDNKFVTIGTFAFPFFFLTILALVILLLLMIFMYYLGYHYRRVQQKFKMRSALTTGNTSEALAVLRKRLETHLEILQDIRHSRILTKEEKQIKEAIEGDLDEIDLDLDAIKQKRLEF